MRFALRALGLFLLAFAGLAALVDGTQSVAAEAVVTTALGQTWYQIDAASLDALQVAVKDGPPAPWGERVWNVVFVSLLRAPTFAVLGVLGALLILAGSPKARVESLRAY